MAEWDGPMESAARGRRPARGGRDRSSVELRRLRGAEARERCPVEGLGAWERREETASAVGLLEDQSSACLPDLQPLRRERMAASPFAFFRGSAVVMASDLARVPCSGIEVQCVGDAHIANFGLFSSRTRHLVFDVNDFDETAPGPWEWDVMRLAASVEVCGRQRGLSGRERRAAVRSCARRYRKAMARFARMGELDVWYAHLDVERELGEIQRELGKKARTIERAVERAAGRDNVAAASRLAHVEDGHLRFNSAPPELVPLRELAPPDGYASSLELERALRDLLGSYFESLPYSRRFLLNRYCVEDVARKVVGVGSVGTRSWVALLRGRDLDDPLVLQVKEARESVVERFWRPAPFERHGERVVQGQRLVQSTSDIMLGWAGVTTPDGGSRDYYVRQLWNAKGSIDLDRVGPESLSCTATLCAEALAHAHARTGDSVAIDSYLGGNDAFDEAMVEFARAYADQNEADYGVFLEHLGKGGS